jgi:hypothetical protein
MKYLFIFLPFFCFAKNDSIPDHLPWDTIPGGDSTLYGVRIDSAYVAKYSSARSSSGFYYGDPEDGSIAIKNDTLYRFVKARWTPCDQHFGKTESYQREKADTSEVKLLVWTGCSLTEIKATKYLLYNEMQVAKNTVGLAVYISETIKVDVIARYISENKWIKPSHVIKEL